MIVQVRKGLMLSVLGAVAFTFCTLDASAQYHEDSIEESWNRAPRHSSSKEAKPMERHSEKDYSWKEMQPPNENAWPYVPKNATQDDYYAVNQTVLDSLSQLYCLSPGYLRKMELKNEALKTRHEHGAAPSDDGRFSYQKDSWNRQEASDESGRRSSLQALHVELMGLLNRCLNR